MYQCSQDIIVIDNYNECNKAFDEHILQPAVRFLGVDCEWNTKRPISLLQVATPTVTLLVRVCNLNFRLPPNVKLVLEDPSIIKVGVNIDNDSDKLFEDCRCKIRSWVDLRHLTITCTSYGTCLVKQIKDFEWELGFYNQDDPNAESYKTAASKRLCWCPKIGLEPLIKNCLNQDLPKNNSARWNDDWETKTLSSNQEVYAANDATAALDIFIALVYTTANNGTLPLSQSLDLSKILPGLTPHLETFTRDFLEIKFVQTRTDMDKIFKLICKTDPTFNIKPYFLPPKTNKTQLLSKEKLAKKIFYKKKAKAEKKAQEAAKPQLDRPLDPLRPDEYVAPLAPPVAPTSSSESGIEQNDITPASSSNNSSFNFRDIQDAFRSTEEPALNETFVKSEPSQNIKDLVKYANRNNVLFYFKHKTDRSVPLVPGFSFGRGSVPPAGYRLFLQAHKSTQVEVTMNYEEFIHSTQAPSVDVVSGCTEFNSRSCQTDLTHTSNQPPPRNGLFIERATPSPTSHVDTPVCPVRTEASTLSQARIESPMPQSTTDDDSDSISSFCSSDYLSANSKVSKGRGRGRGKNTVGLLKKETVTSDSDVERKGRGRGRGSIVGSAPSGIISPNEDTTKRETKSPVYTFASLDVRYKDAPDESNIESALFLPRKPKALGSPVTTAPPETTSPRFDRTPTNSFSSMYEPVTPTNLTTLHADNPLGANYRSYQIQLDELRPQNTDSLRAAFSRSADPYKLNVASTRGASSYRGSSAPSRGYTGKFNSGNNTHENYQYKTDIFRQANERDARSTMFDASTGYTTKYAEEVKYDWAKFRETEGIETGADSNNATKVSLEMDSDEEDEL